MSGMKPPELSEFYRSLRARGVKLDELAEEIGRSRPTLCRVLNGSRRRGPIWERVKARLTAEELALLDVAQSSTWNTRRVEKRPVWTLEKQQRLAKGVGA